jgi:hypothetical protein
MHTQELQTLHCVNTHCGGSVHKRMQSNSVRCRLHKRTGMLQLCMNLNGRLQTIDKQVQFKTACNSVVFCVTLHANSTRLSVYHN